MVENIFVEYNKLGSKEQSYFYINKPNQCPICHSYISPIHIDDNYNFKENLLSIFWECPNCRKTFLSYI